MAFNAVLILTFLVLLRAPFAVAGKIELLSQEACEGQVRLNAEGRLEVTGTNGSTRAFPLEEILVAKLNTPKHERNLLPPGWHSEDLGSLAGTSSEKHGLWHLHVYGDGTNDANNPASHYVYRVIRADSEVVACLDEFTSTNASRAGLMLREKPEPGSGLAWLAVSPDRRLTFSHCEASWHSLKQEEFGQVTLPIWLKLTRQDKDNLVTAWRSTNGLVWEQLSQSRLACKTEVFPEESDDRKPKYYSGLAVTKPNGQGEADAKFQQVSVTIAGLLGEYYADDQFQQLQFIKPDRRVEFWWSEAAPGPDLKPDHFSVRWTGHVTPKYSELYRFHLEADDSARLWVEEQELPPARFEERKPKDAKELPLEAGRKYALKVEFQKVEGAASVRLGWSSPSQRLEVIPNAQLSYTYHDQSPDEQWSGAITNVILPKGVWLRGGSYLAGKVVSADNTAVRVTFAGGKTLSILNTRVAHIVFRDLRRRVAWESSASRTGVFVQSGDFLESEFAGIKAGTLTMDSVLFGRRTFLLDKPEATVLILSEYVPRAAPLEVQLVDGSVLRAARLQAGKNGVLVEDTTVGPLVVPENELVEIRRPGTG